MPHQLELPIIKQVLNIFAPAGEEIVEANYLMAVGQQTLTKVRSNETRATSNDYSHLFVIDLNLIEFN
jgi:hypothetical protein